MRERLLALLPSKDEQATMSVDALLDLVVAAIKSLEPHTGSQPIIIGIAGGSASGKTTQVAAKLQRSFPSGMVNVLSSDHFYRGAQHLKAVEQVTGQPVSWDEPEAVDLHGNAVAIDTLRTGSVCTIPNYNFATSERSGTQLFYPAPVVVSEGLFTLHEPVLSRLDLRIFVSVDVHGQIIRRLLRDITRTGQTPDDILRYLAETVIPMHDRFISVCEPVADLVLRNEYRPETESAKRRMASPQMKFAGWPSAPNMHEVGAEFLGYMVQSDIYFTGPDRDFRTTGEVLRIRSEGDRLSLTYKGPLLGSNGGERFVFTCGIEAETAADLGHIYHRTALTVSKERRLFLADNVLIQHDLVDATGPNDEQVNQAFVTELRLIGRSEHPHDELKAWATRLGLPTKHASLKSYAEMVIDPASFLHAIQ